MRTVLSTFADLQKRACDYYSEQLKKSKQVNGVSVSSHLEAAVKMDIANGMSEEDSRKKWKAPAKQEEPRPDNDVYYVISTYNKFFDIRQCGFNGLNPLSLYDVHEYEKRYLPISEPIIQVLYALDDVYYQHRE